ncbi:hypothetical protein LCGC14_1598220 [marine sediment metagenome]|uniref:Uncharacterized protein n=1 Tax=marine sediment metagenome TaxID=412755 RepID=A0A0F9LC57_9ZZZZ
MKENRNVVLKAESSHLQELKKYKDRFPYRKVIIRELMTIAEEVVENNGEYYKLREFMNTDYLSPIKRRIEVIKKKHNGLHYDDLNEDTVFKDLNKKQKVKAHILKRIEEVAKKNSISDLSQILDLFMIILAIQDFVLGENAEQISKTFDIVRNSILTAAKYVFGDTDLYSRRFYDVRKIKKTIIAIANEVNNGKIKKSSFCHLTQPQFQKLMRLYHTENSIPIDSSIFDHNKVSLVFAKWVYELSDAELEEILMDYPDKLSISEFMVFISEINKNLEILKCLVYNLFTKSSFEYISEITGRSLNLVLKYEQLVYREMVEEK